jgi:hypothetical protein
MGMLVGVGLFNGVGAAFEKGVLGHVVLIVGSLQRLWLIVCK